MNSSGKVVTIFLVIIAILLISLTAISLFFFQKETDRRKLAEIALEEFQLEKVSLEEGLAEIENQNFLLQEKNKEADERLDDLSNELELEKGLREEMKIEANTLKAQLEEAQSSKEALAEAIKEKKGLKEKLTGALAASEKKIQELESKLKVEIQRGEKLGKMYEQREEEMARANKARVQEEVKQEEYDAPSGVELGEIIVVSGEDSEGEEDIAVRTKVPLEETFDVIEKVVEGRILSVDAETEFVIVSLGKMDGVEIGNILAVYRDEDYVGDIRVTRLQPEMSAADLIPPFSIRSIKKNDQVKAK